jgi:lipoate-protein ligase B
VMQAGEIPDTLILVEHPACITLGRGYHRKHIVAGNEELSAQAVAVRATDRGGDVTYHGPGQLVLYAIVDLNGYDRDVHAHARRMEQVVIDALASFGVEGTRDQEYPGVWTIQGKIAAIGLSVKRWVTMHGVALNVAPDMSHFSLIVPCGIQGGRVASLAGVLGSRVEMGEVKSRATNAFEQTFDVKLCTFPR